MAGLLKRGRWNGPTYRSTVTFDAPIDFAFRWCTDFDPGDAKLEGERYARKVVHRDPRHVVYEDLEDGPRGWNWTHTEVDLRPPDQWTMESVGNHREVKADYRLTPLPRNRTRFEISWRRRPALLEFTHLPKAERERETTIAWTRFARALNRDYRRSRARRSAGPNPPGSRQGRRFPGTPVDATRRR